MYPNTRLHLLGRLHKTLKQLHAQRKHIRARYRWDLCARPSQKEPGGQWSVWLIIAGRGFGKTRTGAETVRNWVESNRARRICLLADSLDDGRKVMIEGESGLLNVCPPWNRPTFYPSHGKLKWPSGAEAQLYSAHHYEKLRGPQFDGAWVDELAKFQKPQEAWDQMMMGLRLGQDPKVVVTTTPRPLLFLKNLCAAKDSVVTRGATAENQQNLSRAYLENMQRSYAGTRLGAQELEGHFVEEEGTALWTYEMLHQARIQAEDLPELTYIVVAVDPSVTANQKSDETGIVVVGRDREGRFYVLEDCSGSMEVVTWAHKAVEAYHTFQASCIVAEVNNGGDLVKRVIQGIDASVPVHSVRAMKSKWQRAQPMAALYEIGRVKHIKRFEQLEKQMLTYTPLSQSSPDRLDALVWALSELSGGKNTQRSENALSVWALT